jgi:hypothetical protein
MTNEIETAVTGLVGKPLVGRARIVDMEAFAFGDLMISPNPGAAERLVAEYHLHVQCPWRIVRADRILVGYRDMADPPTGVASIDFNPNEARMTRRDELMDHFIAERTERPRVVVACSATIRGDVRMTFDDDCVLELFPDASAGEDDPEHWRLLLPDDDHLVMSGQGLERLPAAPS